MALGWIIVFAAAITVLFDAAAKKLGSKRAPALVGLILGSFLFLLFAGFPDPGEQSFLIATLIATALGVGAASGTLALVTLGLLNYFERPSAITVGAGATLMYATKPEIAISTAQFPVDLRDALPSEPPTEPAPPPNQDSMTTRVPIDELMEKARKQKR